MKIKNISISELFDNDNASELFSLYSKESQSELVSIQQAPDRAIYEQLEETGTLDTVAVVPSDDTTKIVGFAVMITTVMPHYSQLGSTIESLYIHPDYRKGNIFKSMLERIKDIAVSKGSFNLFLSAPVGSRLDTIASRSSSLCNTHKMYTMDLSKV